MILFCFGTRPEWLKIKPLIALMDGSKYKLLFTGQHPDLLKDVKVDYTIHIGESENRLDQLVSDCLLQFPADDSITSVLVQGDTASAFACAVAAFNRKLRIYYLEAGLRSYNLSHPYPEEGYRQMISRLSDINFCPTLTSMSNLLEEKIDGKVHVTGNTVLDNLVKYKAHCTYSNTVLVTMHRRENHESMKEWFEVLEDLAQANGELEFILPIHPNPNVQKHRHLLQTVKVVEPLQHNELIEILTKCKLVITDSGGLQEEGSFFNKKVIVCRRTTERPEAIETGHLHLCDRPDLLKGIFNRLIADYKIDAKCPYGDGHAAEKILNIINHYEGL